MALSVGAAVLAYLEAQSLGIPWFTWLPDNQKMPYGLIHDGIAAPLDGSSAPHANGGSARVLTEVQVDVWQQVLGPRKDKACGITSGQVAVTDTRIQGGEIGLPVSGFGIPAGATVAAVTPGVGFNLSVAATSTTSSDLTIGTDDQQARIYDPQLPELVAHSLATGKLQSSSLAGTPYRLFGCKLLMGPMELPQSQASNVKHHVIHVQVPRNLQTARV